MVVAGAAEAHVFDQSMYTQILMTERVAVKTKIGFTQIYRFFSALHF